MTTGAEYTNVELLIGRPLNHVLRSDSSKNRLSFVLLLSTCFWKKITAVRPVSMGYFIPLFS
jgi:hypothetical protein